MADFEDDTAGFAIGQQGDIDLTDETQDFRFLTQLSLTAEQSALPRRGEKDFELHGTASQHDALCNSRAAMHDALSYPCIHAPRHKIIGIYDPKYGQTLVENPRGQYFRTMGKADAAGRLHLLPEEALYLVERGNLDLRWPAGYDDNISEGMPFSLQSAYAVLVGKLDLTLERYIVYTGLKRSGYIVHRMPQWGVRQELNLEPTSHKSPPSSKASPFVWLYDLLLRRGVDSAQRGPLVGPGLFRSYREIYSKLAIIPFYDTTSNDWSSDLLDVDLASKTTGSNQEAALDDREQQPPPLRCSYYVWKPRPDFKKSLPGPPDFRIAVINAREGNVPVLEQLDGLLQTTPYDPPPPSTNSQVYRKLKHGWRNVILAVVDQGVVSYLRISEAAFGNETIYERVSRGRGGKGGGGRGKGGRARAGRAR